MTVLGGSLSDKGLFPENFPLRPAINAAFVLFLSGFFVSTCAFVYIVVLLSVSVQVLSHALSCYWLVALLCSPVLCLTFISLLYQRILYSVFVSMKLSLVCF